MSAIQIFDPGSRLVVAKMRPDGTIDHSSVQRLDHWQQGPRSLDLVVHAYGSEMLRILTEELGLVSANEDGLLQSKIIVVRNEEDVRGAVMRLLGKVAEAMIVRNCNSNVYSNRLWAQIARRGLRPSRSLDDYVAVGTGLETTRHRYFQKYRPNDPQRDIIWVHKYHARRELQMLEKGRPAQISAGIQLKVSMDGFQYIYRSDVARAKYEVPLVYFDLCNDYYKLTNAIYQEQRDLQIGTDIVRGKDIDPAIHDALCSYWWLAERIVRGQMSINDLVTPAPLLDACQKDLLESAGGRIITL
ncbi:hypothetical protein [Geopseudomonas aromaticivorans]